MATRKRLMHVAAGMADSFIGRNNDLHGYRAPGLMYREATIVGSLPTDILAVVPALPDEARF